MEGCLADFSWDDWGGLDSVKCQMQRWSTYMLKKLCVKSDQDVGGGVGGAAKAVCVKRAGYRRI